MAVENSEVWSLELVAVIKSAPSGRRSGLKVTVPAPDFVFTFSVAWFTGLFAWPHKSGVQS